MMELVHNFYVKKTRILSVADSGFPRRAAPTLGGGGGTNLILGNFSLCTPLIRQWLFTVGQSKLSQAMVMSYNLWQM